MSSSPQKHTFIVFAPDFDAPGTYEKRLSVREKHVAGAATAVSEGSLKIGGAMLSPESITGGDKKMVGSAFIIEAESLEQVEKTMKSDIYYTSGVWDPAKLVILPYVAALGTTKIV